MIHINNTLEHNEEIYKKELSLQSARILKSVLLFAVVGALGYYAMQPFEYSSNIFTPTYENYLAVRELQTNWTPAIKAISGIIMLATFVNAVFCRNEIVELKRNYIIIQKKVERRLKDTTPNIKKPVIQVVDEFEEERITKKIKNARGVMKKTKLKDGDARLN